MKLFKVFSLNFLIVFLCFFEFSCSQDSDLFQATLDEEILKNEEINIDNNISKDLRAFPSAEGAGAYTIGGRGGKVLHVTTLDDGDYEGTFRWAVMQEFPRIIVFDVSGTIKLKEVLDVRYENKGNLTIAGQTAPKGGITIEGPEVYFSKMSNVIIRYIRVVNTGYFWDKNPKWNRPVFGFAGIRNGIIDHCSFRYSWNSIAVALTDENYPEGQDNITLQKSIMGNCKTGVLVGSAVRDYRLDFAGRNSIHHNLFTNISHRFPNVGGNGQYEVINNLVYNYYWRLSVFYNNSETNLINNLYKAGPSSLGVITSAGDGPVMKIGDNVSGMVNTPKIYSEGNLIDDKGNPLMEDDNRWSRFFALFTNGTIDADENKYRSRTRFPSLGVPVTEEDISSMYETVLNDVGANKYLKEDGSVGEYMDVVDQKYISDVRTNDCTNCKEDKSYPNLGDKSQLVYPKLPENIRSESYDTDRDGMPDLWEKAMGLDPNKNDSGLDKDGDGYTNIEEYLNLVDVQ